MDLQHYLDIIKRRFLTIIVVIAVAMIVVIGKSLFTTPIYSVKTTMRLELDVGVSDFMPRDEYVIRLMSTYKFVLENGTIKDEGLRRLSEQYGPDALQGLHKLSAESVPDSELIRVIVEHEDPLIARDMSNLMANLLIEYAQNSYSAGQKSSLQIMEDQLKQMESQLESMRQKLINLLKSGAPEAETETLKNQIDFQESSYARLLDRYEMARLRDNLYANRISIVQPADLPLRPSNALDFQGVGLTVVVGLIGGLGLVMILENLDTRFRGIQQVEHATQIPVIGAVPRGLLKMGSDAKGNRALEEAYRLLAFNLQSQAQSTGIKTILVTSAVPKEGKSTVASNLAQIMAEQAKTIFLIEGDMRRPVIKKRFGIENGYIGLSNFLAGITALDEAIHPTKQASLFVVSGGPTPPNPTALLASPAMEQTIAYLGNQAQLTILDAPPVLGLADVSVLAPHVDAIILVVNQSVSRREQVTEALKQLQAINARVLGIVFLRQHDVKGYY